MVGRACPFSPEVSCTGCICELIASCALLIALPRWERRIQCRGSSAVYFSTWRHSSKNMDTSRLPMPDLLDERGTFRRLYIEVPQPSTTCAAQKGAAYASRTASSTLLK